MKTAKKTIGKLTAGCVLAFCLVSNIHAQSGPPNPPGGGDGTSNTNTVPDIANYLKYIGQSCSVIDTNNAAANDTNLYNALLAFTNDSGTSPTLQILPYQSNCLLIKASHFDYSGESDRDFTLVVNDKIETPLYKTIDLSNPTNNDQNGWLIQGSVPNWQVTDPMYLIVTNISGDYNAFFRAIPYGGPQIQLSGPQPNDTVSNTITLQATVTDLSGITNEQFEITVDGIPARYSLGASNTINLETKYNPNGAVIVYANAFNNARIYDATNPPDNAKLFFSGSTSMPLDFENDTYLYFAGNMCPPQVGTNYIMFVIDKAQSIDATISDPSNGQVVAEYSGDVPYPATIVIPWNFTEADGVTPYSNDTYTVTFTALDPTTITITNQIDREGVRTAAGCILTYEEEDPGLSGGSYLNSEANKWIGSLAEGLYSALYDDDFASFTIYTVGDIGANRDNPTWTSFPFVLTHGEEQTWANETLLSVTNLAFSDFGFYMGHGNGAEIGGGPRGSTFVNSFLNTTTLKSYVAAKAAFPNWRMRKVALWACYTDTTSDLTAGGTYPTWPDACGIRPTSAQLSTWMMKNVGLFFGGALAQAGYSGTFGNTSVEVASDFDELWVTGPNPYPDGCDPTYSFSWALSQIRGMNPELDKAQPALIGFSYLPFAGVYDGQLMTNNVSNVKR